MHWASVLLTTGDTGAAPGASVARAVPDLSRMAGFPSGVLLAPGGFSWMVTAHGGKCATCADSVFDGRVERQWAVVDTVR